MPETPDALSGVSFRVGRGISVSNLRFRKRKRDALLRMISCLAVALAAFSATGPAWSSNVSAAEPNAAVAEALFSGRIAQTVERISPSVVAIIGRQAPSDEGEREVDRFQLAHGTGLIVRPDGWIVTNAHVVKDLEGLTVVTSDGRQFPGRAVFADEESDLALVRINALRLPAASLASEVRVQPGDPVVAIGTPVSFSLRNSVTVGVVSGVDRSVNGKYRLLQTDAAINPGNSGGPLVDAEGRVIGINSLKFVDYGVDNVGFAIPADTVRVVLDHFEKYGRVRRAYLGFETEESWAAVIGLPTDDPLEVVLVDGSSKAAAAGVREGDKLLAVDGRPVHTLLELNELLKRYLPGDRVRLTMESDGRTVVREIELAEEPEAPPTRKTGTPEVPASADGSRNGAETRVDLWLRLGDGQAMANGRVVDVQPPRLVNGSAVAPLEPVAAAFGARLVAEKDGGVVLTDGKRSIRMYAGQKTVVVDGKSEEWTTAPEVAGGVWWAPVRAVAEAFGAAVKFYPQTGEIVVARLPEGNPFGGARLHEDADKKRIGDSYQNWSMKYPSSLMKVYQSSNADRVMFSDMKGDYELSLAVERIAEANSPDDLIDRLKDETYKTVIDSRYVSDAAYPYAFVLAKSGNVYEELRAYQNDGRLYVLQFETREELYNNPSKYKIFQDLLNSFRPVFAANDPLIKDISKFKDGFRKYVSATYAYSFELPAGWESGESETRFYHTDDERLELKVTVSSAAEGDTLDAWVERQRRRFEETVLPSYRRIGDAEPSTVAGVPARSVTYRVTEGDDWTESRVLYLFKGPYKYRFILSYGKSSDLRAADMMFRSLTSSLSIDTDALDRRFGRLPDPDEAFGTGQKSRYASRKYHYSLEVPAYWYKNADLSDGSAVSYAFDGGSFDVQIQEEGTLQDQVRQTEAVLKQMESFGLGKLVESTSITFQGSPAHRFVVETTEHGVIERTTMYLAEHGGRVYMIAYRLKEAYATPFNLARIDEALRSFRWTDEAGA